jgi:hypothetical protein
MLLANSAVISEAAGAPAWKRTPEPNSWQFGDLWSAFPEFANSIIERAELGPEGPTVRDRTGSVFPALSWCWFPSGGLEPRLGRNLHHLVTTVHDLAVRGVGFRVLTGQGAQIDTTTAAGKLIFGIFAALAEFERELIVERTKAGIAAARARGRNGGRPYKMTAAKVRLAQAAMGQPETKVEELCVELGVTRQTLYRHVAPDGSLRADGLRLLERKRP